MDDIDPVVVALLCVLAVLIFLGGISVGTREGIKEIASDCERLGAFYVGERTFLCEAKK